jgi:hypothetical protein
VYRLFLGYARVCDERREELGYTEDIYGSGVYRNELFDTTASVMDLIISGVYMDVYGH